MRTNLRIIQPLLAVTLGLLANSIAQAAPDPAFMEPVQSVFDQYIKIQTALAGDSMKDVASSASAIATSVRGDSMKMLSPKVADQADALAKARNLAAAREALKPLSKSLIGYLAANRVTGSKYVEVYCPMAKASWLQTDPVVNNPYMGKEMARCGQFVQSGASSQSGYTGHAQGGPNQMGH